MRVLFLTHRLPYAPDRGDRIRAYHILRTLKGHAHVDLVSLVHHRSEAARIEALHALTDSVHTAPVPRFRNGAMGVWSLAGSTPLTHILLSSPALRRQLERLVAASPPDVVLAYCSGMARIAMEPPLAKFPRVIELVDVDSLKWAELAEVTSPPMRWIYRREAARLADFERRAIQAAFATTVVNDRERAALADRVTTASVVTIPSGVDGEYWRPTSAPQDSRDVVFCGVMNYRPNEDAAVWLTRQVWPIVRRCVPGARLRIVGSHPTFRVRRLAAADVDVTGEVPDVRPYLWNAAVAAAPLLMARGIQNKVLEAVAAGLPAVVTPIVADGLPAAVLPACVVARDAIAFAGALVLQLCRTPDERRTMALQSDLRELAWSHRLRPLVNLLEAAAGRAMKVG